MQTSCVQYPANDPVIVVHRSIFELCERNYTAAAVLSYFAYWHNIKLEMQAKARQANDVAESHGDKRTQDESLWQFHTEEDIEFHIMSASRKTIREAIRYLEERGFITTGSNPIPRYHFDKTRYILFHPDVVNSHAAELPNPSGNSAARYGKIAARYGKIAAAIPEITSEISPEISRSPPVVLRTTSPRRGDTYTPGFERFYEIYPIKKGKEAAWKAWKKEKLEPRCEEMVEAVRHHLEHNTDWHRGAIKHPATFLNGRCWEDELAADTFASLGNKRFIEEC